MPKSESRAENLKNKDEKVKKISNSSKEDKKVSKAENLKKTSTKSSSNSKKAVTNTEKTVAKQNVSKSATTAKKSSNSKTAETSKNKVTTKSSNASSNKTNTSVGNKKTSSKESKVDSKVAENTTKKKSTNNSTTKAKDLASDKKNIATETKKVVENKVEEIKPKESAIISKIKSFLKKIVEIQEEAKKEKIEQKEKAAKEIAQKENKEIEQEKKNSYNLEYYDLPYRYNETVVKILAQTPKRLFVYWDIADSDKERYLKAFGESFFYDTYPVLLIHNDDKNYTFEIPINDFANSWYLDINDPKSKYTIQLGRKFKDQSKLGYVNREQVRDENIVLQNNYLPITTSNTLEVPNDHILFENLKPYVVYRNVKNHEEKLVDISNLEFAKKMGKVYNIYEVYKEIYKNEMEDESLLDLLNPSSMSSSSFK